MTVNTVVESSLIDQINTLTIQLETSRECRRVAEEALVEERKKQRTQRVALTEKVRVTEQELANERQHANKLLDQLKTKQTEIETLKGKLATERSRNEVTAFQTMQEFTKELDRAILFRGTDPQRAKLQSIAQTLRALASQATFVARDFENMA